MEDQPDASQTGPAEQRHDCVHGLRRRRMQRMVTNAAPPRTVDRIREQMVEIHHHRCQHDQGRAPPTMPKERRDEERHQYVKDHVYHRPYFHMESLCALFS